MILARTVANTVHVQALLESMTPEEFRDWKHEFERRPWDCGWLPEETESEATSDPLAIMRRQAGV